MKITLPYWKLTNAELKNVANCELDTRHPGLPCDRTPDGLIDCQHCPVGHYCGFIAIDAQRKLLEYLIAHPDKAEWTEEEKQDCIKIRTLKVMYKELEASQ